MFKRYLLSIFLIINFVNTKIAICEELTANIPESIMNEVLTLKRQSNEIIAQNKENSLLLNKDPKKSKANNLYIFVSFSMGKQNLIQLAKELKQLNTQGKYTGQLVLRGFHQGSYRKTASYLKDIITVSGIGMIVDPILFRKFEIRRVPSFVLMSKERASNKCTYMPREFDKLTGNVSINYALSELKSKGEV